MSINNLEYDATASWSGYSYQGKVAIYTTLRKINKLYKTGNELVVHDYCLELEWLEDFSILYKNCEGVLVYESIHQVKARQDTDISDYSDALIKLLQKSESDPNIIHSYLHTTRQIDYHKNWKEELKKVSINDKIIKNWISQIDILLGDIDEKNKFLKDFNKKRSAFSKQLKKHSSQDKISAKNIDDALKKFKSELEESLDRIQKGFTDNSLNKTNLYLYGNGFEYCSLNEIENLIKEEILVYWSNFKGSEWKLRDEGLLQIVLLCLIGIIDSHITKRHKNYGSKEIEKLYFDEFEEILKSDRPIERCKEYYLFTIKKKLIEFCEEYESICIEECEAENDFCICTYCQIKEFKNNISEMDFDRINEMLIVTNPDVHSKFDESGFIDYCERGKYFNPFLKGLKTITSPYEDKKTPVSYTGNDKKQYLLTTLNNVGGFKDPIKKVCLNIISNSELKHIFMDYKVLISNDLVSNSILNDAGDYIGKFKIETNNIYHFNDVSIKPLDSCLDILKPEV